MHREQQILKPQHFGKYQIAVVWGTHSEQLQRELPQPEKEMRIRIQRLDEKPKSLQKDQSLQQDTISTALKIYLSQPTVEH